MKPEITLNGQSWPCRPTMGAMLRFKKETGREVTDIDPSSPTDLFVYLYCCAASACAAQGRDFPYTLMQFADSLSPEDVSAWAASLGGEGGGQEGGEGGEEKKTSR